MKSEYLHDSLSAIEHLLSHPPTSGSSPTQWADYRSRLLRHRSSVREAIEADILGGAKIDQEQVAPVAPHFCSDPRTKALAKQLEVLPGLKLDHTYLIRKGRDVIGIVTMPYSHAPDFKDAGQTDLAMWASYDDLSWWYPQQTRLTIVFIRPHADG
ncbi:hypothetical protein ACFMBG_17045 [Leisingera sp. D0M16]|uniref:hypothetical protein n=1 Tax=Leisingera coralii TaxID=3351347 RepID=UPI003B78E205